MIRKAVSVAIIALTITQAALSASSVPPLLVRGYSQEATQAVELRLSKMTLEEKVGQLIMPIIYPSSEEIKILEAEKMLDACHAGGVLFQKGNAYKQYLMARRLQQSRSLGLLIAADNEWGLAMRLSPAIRYPRNMALGRLPEAQITNYGSHVARQCRVIGIQVSFAPVLDVNNNPNNPVIGTRSFGEDPFVVAKMGAAYAKGMEKENVMAVAKHFPGHGDTKRDSHKTLPRIGGSRQSLEKCELVPFRCFIQGGFSGVMTAHLSIPAYDNSGTPASLSPKITRELLRQELGFTGLIFTDALAMDGARTTKGLPLGVEALLAGNTILLGPKDPIRMHQDIVNAVKRGIIPEELIDDCCKRVLRAKWSLLGDQFKLPQKPLLGEEKFYQLFNKEEYCRSADDLWLNSIDVQRGEEFLTNLACGEISKLKIGLLSVGRNSEKANVTLSKILKKIGVSSVIVLSSKTRNTEKWITQLAPCDIVLTNAFGQVNEAQAEDIEKIAKSKALVFTLFDTPYRLKSWTRFIPSAQVISVAFEATEEALRASAVRYLCPSKKINIVLPEERNRYNRQGDSGQKNSREAYSSISPSAFSNSKVALSSKKNTVPKKGTHIGNRFDKVDSLAMAGLRIKAYPGCEIVAIYKGNLVYQKAFGRLTYSSNSPKVTDSTLYDIASVTKAVAIAPAFMTLVGDGKLKLSDRVDKYLQELNGSAAGSLTIKELLLHEGGLPATINFFEKLVDTSSLPQGKIFYYKRGKNLRQIDANVWVPKGLSLSEKYLSRTKDSEYTLPFSEDYYISKRFREEILDSIANISLKRRGFPRYSDVGYILLGMVVEEVSHQRLDLFLKEEIYDRLGLRFLLFNPLPVFNKSQIAPTQKDNYLRGKVWGLVDDENAACLGGVSGNAGLFANALDLAKIGLLLMDNGEWGNDLILHPLTVKLFKTIKGKGGKRSLGFLCGYKGNPNLPEEASPGTFGHTGFTGTCLWIDPKKDLVIAFLSNRTYPSRRNNKLGKENLRPKILSAFYEVLD